MPTALPKGEHHLLDCKQKIAELAESRGIGAALQSQIGSSLFERAQRRIQLEQRTRQKNLESIILAAEQLSDTTTAHDLDPDWFSCFLSLVEQISSHSMQQLWAKILAQELRSPGSFSMRAMRILQQMTQREARIFQHACHLTCNYGGDQGRKLLLGFYQEGGFLRRMENHKLSLGKYQLTYSQLLQLTDLGLIHGSELESGEIGPQGVLLIYPPERWLLRPKRGKQRLFYHRFTPMGNELAHLIPPDPIKNYAEDLRALLGLGFTIDS